MRKTFGLVSLFALTACLAASAAVKPLPAKPAAAKESKCITCHAGTSPSIVAQWRASAHSRMGVDCASCHKTTEGAPGSKKHFEGSSITPVVSPKVCGQCHTREETEFTASHHASAAKFIGSLDNILGEMVEGSPAADSGCRQCHGSTIKPSKDGEIDSASWPNSGIGRVNPDGSAGACSACHARHTFSLSQVREPETCGRCHMGPDHPQMEIFNESKHGILYRAAKDKMNLSSKSWIVGKDYTAAPNCATCHVGAGGSQGSTHDVGARISWTLRPAVSTKLENADTRRQSMQGICTECHSGSYVASFYKQYDASVNLYNDKFAKPAKDIMDKLHAQKLLTDTPFDEKLEWTYYLMWHHEGRRARHGAAMMGADYAQWHGFFEVADRFYNEFLPEVKKLNPGLVDEVLSKDEHKWKTGLSAEERQKVLEYYKSRYGQ